MASRTITLTDRRPITIDEEKYPVIALAKYHDGQVECQANRKWTIIVREPLDSSARRIVYGIYDTNYQNSTSLRGGYIIDLDGDANGDAKTLDRLTVEKIKAVAAHINAPSHLTDACIAHMPAEEID